MGWQIAETYDLAGVSGKEVLGHPEAKRMLADVKRRHVKAVVFTKLARLTRNAKELMDISEYFRQHDADLVSLQENIDTSTPSGRLFYNIVSVMAQWEREEIADCVRSSIPIRARLGKPINGKAPYGYEWKDKRLAIHPAEAPVRKLIHELFLEHKRLKTVARILNERGYRSRNGKEWSDMTVRFQILDPTPKGVYRRNYTRNNGKGKPWTIKPEAEHIFNEAPAIVSEELWESCHALLEARRTTRTAPQKKPAHLFAGFVSCRCGAPMYVPSNSPKYTCKGCRNKIPCADLEEIFLEEVTGFLVNPEHVRTYLAKASETALEKERLLEAHKTEMTKLRSDADKLVELYTAGGLNIEQFKERHEPLDGRKRQLAEELPRLEAQVDLLRMGGVTGDDMIREAADLGTRWKSMDGDEKRRIVELMLTGIEIGPGEMKISLVQLPSYKETANWQDMSIPTLPFCHRAIHVTLPQLFPSEHSIRGYPSKPETVGQHVRKRRLDLGMGQIEAASIIGVSPWVLELWEREKRPPCGTDWSRIIRFLGHDPRPTPNSLSAWLVWFRDLIGLDQRDFAKNLGIGVRTLRQWERELTPVKKDDFATLEKLAKENSVAFVELRQTIEFPCLQSLHSIPWSNQNFSPVQSRRKGKVPLVDHSRLPIPDPERSLARKKEYFYAYYQSLILLPPLLWCVLKLVSEG